MLRKVNNEDIVTVDLNVLCDCFPKVGVLDEAQGIIRPEDAKVCEFTAQRLDGIGRRTLY